MSLDWFAANPAKKITGVRRRSILLPAAAAFSGAYLPLTFSTVVFGYYPVLIDVLVVLTAVLCSVIACALVSWAGPWADAEDEQSTAERRGWQLLTAGGALMFIGRAIYGVAQALSGEPVSGIPLADIIFGLAFLALVAGLLTFPWSSGEPNTKDVLVDSGIVLVVAATILWPLIVGPVASGEYQNQVNLRTMWMHILGIFILTFSVLWVVMKGVRDELWGVATALAAAVGVMVLIEVGYLSFLVAESADPLPLLFVNAMTALAYLMIAVAALFRLQAQSPEQGDDGVSLAQQQRPLHRWEIILPYPLVGVILTVRFIMEAFDWRTAYAGGMVIGSVAIVALLMYRQFQLLRYNDRLYERVAGAAIRDGLTGLYNHRAMQEILRKQAAQADRSGWALAVIFLDVDRFKKYNDTYGHRQGDGLLTSIAELLLQECREYDYIGRYGGEEFMVISPDITSESAHMLAERLRTSIEGTQYVHNGTVSAVTASVGVALYPDDGEAPDQVLERADEAMYRAKAAGRNQTVLFRTA